MYGNKRAWAVLAIFFGGSAALACMIDLPNMLTNNRGQTFKEVVANSFRFEIEKLGKKPDASIVPVEGEDEYANPEKQIYLSGAPALRANQLDHLAQGLPADQAAALRKLQETDNADAILADQSGLPKAVLLYEAGAANYRHGQRDKALERFRAILDLPADQRALRAAFAQFMIARVARDGDDSSAAGDYAKVRDLVQAGASDPAGLAAASLGEEARIHLRKAGAVQGDDGTVTASTAPAYIAEIGQAIDLYAEQARSGSRSGLASLRVVAQQLLSDESLVAASAEAPAGRRLIVGFLLARFANQVPDPNTEEEGDSVELDHARVIDILVGASRRHAPDWLPDRDLLANLAYQEGRYDVAGDLAKDAPGPLAAWVKAKLALQTGDIAAATGFYAEAIRAFPTEKTTLDDPSRHRLQAEAGVLSLARGEYVEAMRHLFLSENNWADTAYVAERVLTVDELKKFVDDSVKEDKPDTDAAKLRDLLARRLMRARREKEATPYFPDTETRGKAEELAAARHQAEHGWTDLGRAEGYYRMAVLEREDGLELFGSERYPDFFMWQGQLDFGPDLNQGDVVPPFVTEDEHHRFEASQILPDLRFHYRYLAGEDAGRAADFLPPRSQAYAAALCHAWSWANMREAEKATAYYRRYLAKGAYKAWKLDGDGNCVEPDFARARWTPVKLWWIGVRHSAAGIFHKKKA